MRRFIDGITTANEPIRPALFEDSHGYTELTGIRSIREGGIDISSWKVSFVEETDNGYCGYSQLLPLFKKKVVRKAPSKII